MEPRYSFRIGSSHDDRYSREIDRAFAHPHLRFHRPTRRCRERLAGSPRSGAQVIRIEDPVRQGKWDILRGSEPYKDDRRGIEFGGGFQNHNVEKLGITLNLRTDRGKELLRQLVEISDVVSENFAAGVLERWGFDYPALRAIKDDIIYVSNCGFGHTGPYRSFRTWGPIVQAACGLTFSSGLPGLPPAGWGYSLHGSSRRQHHGDRDPVRARASPTHRRRAVGRHVVHRGRRVVARSGGARLHGQRPPAAPRRHAELEPQPVPSDGTARHLRLRRRRRLGRRVVSRRSRLGAHRRGDRPNRGVAMPATPRSPAGSSTRTNSTSRSTP